MIMPSLHMVLSMSSKNNGLSVLKLMQRPVKFCFIMAKMKTMPHVELH